MQDRLDCFRELHKQGYELKKSVAYLLLQLDKDTKFVLFFRHNNQVAIERKVKGVRLVYSPTGVSKRKDQLNSQDILFPLYLYTQSEKVLNLFKSNEFILTKDPFQMKSIVFLDLPLKEV